MKKIKAVFFAIFIVGLINVACDNGSEATSYPSIKVVNQLSSGRITSVSLVGYQFNSLSIESGDSNTFVLDKGMPSGYENINIVVGYYSGTSFTRNKKYNIINGATITVTLKGVSNSAYLE